MLRGELGDPPGGFPQPFTELALSRAASPPADPPLNDGVRARLEQPGEDRRQALSEILFAGPYRDYEQAAARFGDIATIPTRAFLYGLVEDEEVVVELERGVRVVFELEAVGEPDEHAMRTVLARVNGQVRPVDVRDNAAESSAATIERANPQNPGHLAAPVTGVVTLQVAVGEDVEQGQPVAMIEAMKMESTVSAPLAGRVARITVSSGTRLEHGDLLLEITPR
jgi:pyruvate carboxylase